MGDTANTTGGKNKQVNPEKNGKMKNWFKGIKAEFKKIIWPDKDKLIKETIAVVVTSVVIGFIIAALDTLIQVGFDKLLMIG